MQKTKIYSKKVITQEEIKPNLAKPQLAARETQSVSRSPLPQTSPTVLRRINQISNQLNNFQFRDTVRDSSYSPIIQKKKLSKMEQPTLATQTKIEDVTLIAEEKNNDQLDKQLAKIEKSPILLKDLLKNHFPKGYIQANIPENRKLRRINRMEFNSINLLSREKEENYRS